MKKNDKNLELSFPGKREEIPEIIKVIIENLKLFFPDNSHGTKLELILEELLINIIDYAYENKKGLIGIKTRADINSYFVTIEDHGDLFNPLKEEPPDIGLSLEERKIGGLGIHLVKNMADEIEYKRENNKNIISFTLKIK